MKLGYQLSLIVDNILKKQGYDRKISVFDERFSLFTSDELDQIERIELTKIDDVFGIENLVNLNEILIDSIDFNKINTGDSIKNSTFINKIVDFGFLNNFRKLETLQIKNDINITSLDVSELKNLKNIILVHNPNLSELKGLEELKNLENVLIYGNSITSDFDIEKYIYNTISTANNVLDISMYTSAIKGDRNIAKSVRDSALLGETQLKFGEYVGFLDMSILTPENLYDMYSKLDVMFKRNNLYNASDYDKISFVYNYIMRNVRFAKNELKERNDKVIEYRVQRTKIPEYLIKNLISLHNSYITFHFKRANCEGIVNLMRFMFDMLGIPSANVHCIDKRYNSHYFTNHAVIRVMFENKWYYCDITYDNKNPENYFMKTIDELGNTHMFNDFEIMINEENENEQYYGKYIKK